jgi:2-phosphoglycerate kinase
MNPDNNALRRTYFISGPPRIGKSILAFALAEKIKGHVVSTDAIRNAAKKSCSDKNSDLFIINRTENISEKEWMKNHAEQPEIALDYQNKESQAVWPSLVSFCNTFCEDNAIHIVEGVALLPSLVNEMGYKPSHVIYIGNTSADHLPAMVSYAKRFPEQDWMMALNYSPEKIAAMANFIRVMSLYFKSEAEKYDFPYFEISDDNFEDSIAKTIENIIA